MHNHEMLVTSGAFQSAPYISFFKGYFVSWFENTGENYTEHSSVQNSNLLILNDTLHPSLGRGEETNIETKFKLWIE